MHQRGARGRRSVADHAPPMMVPRPRPRVPQQYADADQEIPEVVRQRRRRVFRWGLVWVVPVILVWALFIQRVPGPDFTWQELMGSAGVSLRNEDFFSQLAVMGLVLIATVYAIRTLGSRD